jgi:hypothetical protein
LSRFLALLLLTIALVSPALARADIRLSLDVMRLSLQRMDGSQPLLRRALSLPAARAADETPIFEPFRVGAVFWHFEVKQLTLSQAQHLGETDVAQREGALPTSAPAGTFSRGGSTEHARLLRLPRLRF